MKVALVQFEVKIKENLGKTLKRVNDFIKTAYKKNCSLICFPEDFLFGPFDYYDKKKQENLVKKAPKIIQWFSKKAHQFKINIIAGTVIRKEKNRLLNSCFVFNKNGKIIYIHNKQKLVPYGFEKNNVSKGKNIIKPFLIDDIKCGVLICRELFYPKLFLTLRKKGFEMVFIPAFWSKRSSDYLNHQLKNNYHFLSEMRVVDALCQARSFENEIVVCFVNTCGNLKNNKDFDVLLGRTQICYPFYSYVKKINQNKQAIIIFEYDKSIIQDAKTAYQLFP
jgi:predicted amidohydrolase